MKLSQVQKEPPFEGWTAVRINYPVKIPNTNGDGFSETIEVEVDAWKDLDGEIIIEGEVKAQLESIKARRMGLMSPDEIKELRAELGLTQKRLSELLQIGEKSWTRWETGRERPSRSINVLLCALRDERIDEEYLESLRTGTKPPAQVWSGAIRQFRTYASAEVQPADIWVTSLAALSKTREEDWNLEFMPSVESVWQKKSAALVAHCLHPEVQTGKVHPFSTCGRSVADLSAARRSPVQSAAETTEMLLAS